VVAPFEALLEEFHLPLGLGELGLQGLGKGDAFFETGQGGFQAQVAALQLLDQGFQLVQAFVEGGG